MGRKKLIGLLIFALVIIEVLFVFKFIPELEAVSNASMLDMQYYNNQIFYETLEAYGDEGLSIYNQMQILDLLFPLVYGSLFFLLLKQLGAKYPMIPLVGMGFDLLENLSIRLLIIFKWPSVPTWTFAFTALKFLVMGISMGYIIYSKIKYDSNKK